MSDGPKLPLSRAQEVAEELVTLIRSSCERVEIAGSIRRVRPQIGDVELVVIPRIEDEEIVRRGEILPVYERVNKLWQTLDTFVPSYTLKGERYRQFTWPIDRHVEDPIERRIKVDVFTARPETWGNILLIRTGSAPLSQHVVTRLAMNRKPTFEGAVRDAAGIEPDEIRGAVPSWADKRKAAMPVIPTPTEEDVFRLAGMKYLPPAQRSWL